MNAGMYSYESVVHMCIQICLCVETHLIIMHGRYTCTIHIIDSCYCNGERVFAANR